MNSLAVECLHQLISISQRTKAEASDIYWYIKHQIEDYGYLSLYDLYKYCGKAVPDELKKLGWTDDDGLCIIYAMNKFHIGMHKAKPILV